MLERYHDTPCGRIRYWVSIPAPEDRPCLILLPGLTADHRLFEAQLSHFEGRYPLLVWDAPGHAASRPFRLEFDLTDKARWLSEIIAAEHLKRPVIVGQSMGGYVGQVFMQMFPDVLSGFISIDSAPLQRQYATAIELFLLRHTEGIYRRYPWRALLRDGCRGTAETENGRRIMREMMESYSHAEYAGLAGHGYRMLADAIAADLPYCICCPALLLCGEKDRAGSTRRYTRAWHSETGLPLVWLPGAGHNSNTDCPELVNELIERFITEQAQN